MNRILLLLTFLLSSGYHLSAQQIPLFSQYRENQSVLNPAALNMDFMMYEYNLSAGLSYRSQWTGVGAALGSEYSPNTKTGRFEAIFPRSKVFTGLSVIQDEAGPISTLGGYLRGGYIISEDPAYGGASLGLSLGLLQYRIDFSHPALMEAPVSIGRDALKKIYPDAGLGLFVYKKMEKGALEGDWIFMGLSVPQLFELNLTTAGTGTDLDVIDTRFVTKVYGQFGLMKYLSGGSLFEAILWAKYVDTFNGVTLNPNLRYYISNLFWLGAGVDLPLRFDNEVLNVLNSINGGLTYSDASVLFETGFYLGENVGMYDNNLKIGFGFGFILGSYDNPFKNTFEINVVYTRDTDKGRH